MRKALVQINDRIPHVYKRLDVTKLKDKEIVYLGDRGDIERNMNEHLPWVDGAYLFEWHFTVIMELGNESSN